MLTIHHCPGQTTVDRPDLVAHVFHAKQQALLKKIRDGYFGQVAGFVYTIKYQKRGLPHMHLLIFLESQDKITVMVGPGRSKRSLGWFDRRFHDTDNSRVEGSRYRR